MKLKRKLKVEGKKRKLYKRKSFIKDIGVIMAKKSNLKVENIVATTSLGKEIPLTKLARMQSNTEYNPEQFPGLVLRVEKPKSAVLVFSSGNLVCTGTKSVAQVKEVIAAVIKQIAKIGVKVTEKPKITV